MAVKRTEAMIQKAIMDYLTMIAGVYAFRAGSGAVQTMQGRYFKTGRPGVPDIVACLPMSGGQIGGRFVGFEVKTATGKQSQAQKKAQADIEAAGGEYYIARSVGDVREVVER